MRTFGLVLSALALAACAHMPIAAPAGQSDWDHTLEKARRNVAAGNYFAADKLLDEYVRVHPDTREAREAAFWKAAYMVDPANPSGSLSGGISALDGYLASTDSTGWYYAQALVLRRTAAAAEGVSVMASTASTASATPTEAVKDTVVVVSKSRDEEIASLKDQLAKSKDDLAKANAELDRIKKRLANPSN
jgi:TolA-binding protein